MASARRVAAGRSGTLASEAWTAGCRDVQAAINWATSRGEATGRPFQTAFRQVMATQGAASPTAGPTAEMAKRAHAPPAGRRNRDQEPDDRRASADLAATGQPTGRSTKAKSGRIRKPAAGSDRNSAPAKEAGPAVDRQAVDPSEFIDDMRKLRQLVAKYGKKGLADLIGLLGG